MKSMGQFEYCASIRFPASNKSAAECNRYAALAPGPTTIAKSLYTAIINDLHFKKEKSYKNIEENKLEHNLRRGMPVI